MGAERGRKQIAKPDAPASPWVVVRCRRCAAPLTRPLARLTDRSLLSGQDGEPYLPRGWFLVATADCPYHGSLGQLFTNLGDLTFTAHHPDSRRRNGCCGLDGCDGRNTVCYEGHEVGTECSDCWMPHAMRFDPACVSLHPQETVAGDLTRPDLAWLAWQGGVIPKLAETIRVERRFRDLPVLADALEEAGCAEAELLAHCRRPGPHRGGCWVVQLLLGSEGTP